MLYTLNVIFFLQKHFNTLILYLFYVNAVDSIQRMAYGQTVKDTPFHDIFVVPKVQRSVDCNFNGLHAVLCISSPQNSSSILRSKNKVEDT